MSGLNSSRFWLVPCMLCVWAVCEAQDAEHVIVGGAVQQLAGGDGESLSVLWTRAFESGLVSAGASRTQVGDSDWTLVHGGGVRRLPGGWTLSGDIDLGPATIDGAESTFTKVRAEASTAVFDRWNLSVEETFVNVDKIRGHLITAGSFLTVSDATSIQARLTGSVQGNLDQQTVSLRFDHRRRRLNFLGGLAFGRSNNHLLLNVPAIEAGTNRWLQGFAGVSLPLKPFEMTIVAESAELGEVRRKGLSVTFRLPVKRSG